MTIPPLSPLGHLPQGRYQTDLVEVEQRFVHNLDPIRSDLWNELRQAMTWVRGAVPLCAIWLAGSFTSNKPQPEDIDVLFWVDSREAAKVPQGSQNSQLLSVFSNQQAKTVLNLRLDTYLVAWVSDPASTHSTEVLDYFTNRGYWDDWWQRLRSGPKSAAPTPSDSLPRRGYLEVIIDGFQP